MPEAEVLIVEQLERSSDKAPFKAKDGNGKVWIRWDQDWLPLIGQRASLTYEDKTRDYNGRTFTDSVVSEAHPKTEDEPQEPPALGTGDYVTGQKPAIEARRIFCSTAANQATQLTDMLMRHQTGREVTPELVRAAWDAMFDHVFNIITVRGDALNRGEDDFPF